MEALGAFVAFVIVMAACLGISLWLNGAQCMAKWSADFQPTFGMFEGCQIVVDGKRIPSANYRVM